MAVTSRVKLVCVGGPSDGKAVGLEPGTTHLRVFDPPRPRAEREWEGTDTWSKRKVYQTLPMTTYVVVTLKFPGDAQGVQYLRPQSWTDSQSLEHLIATHLKAVVQKIVDEGQP